MVILIDLLICSVHLDWKSNEVPKSQGQVQLRHYGQGGELFCLDDDMTWLHRKYSVKVGGNVSFHACFQMESPSESD